MLCVLAFIAASALCVAPALLWVLCGLALIAAGALCVAPALLWVLCVLASFAVDALCVAPAVLWTRERRDGCALEPHLGHLLVCV